MCLETNLLKCIKQIGDIVQNGFEDLRETASYQGFYYGNSNCKMAVFGSIF